MVIIASPYPPLEIGTLKNVEDETDYALMKKYKNSRKKEKRKKKKLKSNGRKKGKKREYRPQRFIVMHFGIAILDVVLRWTAEMKAPSKHIRSDVISAFKPAKKEKLNIQSKRNKTRSTSC